MSHPYDQGSSNPYEQNRPDPYGSGPTGGDPYGSGPYGGTPQGSNPYGGSPYGVSPYGGDPYGGGPAQQDHPRGTTVLVLGILGLVLCLPAGIVAWVMGTKVLREIDANPGAYRNRQTVNVGRILGMVATILGVLVLLIYIVAFAYLGATGAMNS
jgi:hypothetical protein